MNEYKFPNKEMIIVDPTVSISGDFGGHFKDNVMDPYFYIDVILKTEKVTCIVRLEADYLPEDSTPQSFAKWVGEQMEKHLIEE